MLTIQRLKTYLSYQYGDPETARLFADWESNLKIDLAAWTAELAALQSRRVDTRRVFMNAFERVTKLLEMLRQGQQDCCLTNQISP